jgi:hypothetical protein
MIDDIAGRREDAVGQPIRTRPGSGRRTRSPLAGQSRRYCQTFSVGFSSGDLGGNASRLMLAGTLNFGHVSNQPGTSRSTACAPGDTACEISARCTLIVALLHHGSTRRRPRAGGRSHQRCSSKQCVGRAVRTVGLGDGPIIEGEHLFGAEVVEDQDQDDGGIEAVSLNLQNERELGVPLSWNPISMRLR